MTVRSPIDVSPPRRPSREYRVYPALIERCAALEPIATAIAHPCDESSLQGAIEAAEAGLIRPILVGPEARIRAVAEQCGVDLAPYRVVDAPHSHAAAAQAVAIVRAGEAEALMKGSLHTDELMAEVVRKDTGLRTERRISHAFIMDVPTYPKPLVVTDAAINIFPDLETKADIVQNAIDMAHAFGREMPKVAILSAVETVTPKIPSTIDAAALCKMAERGQITGGAARRPAGLRQRDQQGGGGDQGHPLRGRGRCRHPAGAGPRGRQHSGQAADLPRQCRCRRHRAGRPGADHPDLARRQRARPHGVLRHRRAAGRPAPARRARSQRSSRAMADAVLTINAGSSSLKFSLWRVDGQAPALALEGQIEGIGTAPHMKAKDAQRQAAGRCAAGRTRAWITPPSSACSASGCASSWAIPGSPASAIASCTAASTSQHRCGSTRRCSRKLDKLCPLAPLHQPHNLAGIRAVAAAQPDLPQVACFDTAFHRAHPELADWFALPRRFYDDGIRRYGFHGLSYEYIAQHPARGRARAADARVVVAHLGSGASMCAMRAGRSVDSTMGFTALDGLPMGTRCGALDPGVVLHLIRAYGMDADAIEAMLYHDCGLKGVSGISNDMRDLLASDDPRAAQAVELFVWHIASELGALAAVLGGLDAFVFTAGIGERSPEIRAAGLRARRAGSALRSTTPPTMPAARASRAPRARSRCSRSRPTRSR